MSAKAYAEFAGEASGVLSAYERAFAREARRASETGDERAAFALFEASHGYAVLVASGALFRLALDLGGASVQTPE